MIGVGGPILESVTPVLEWIAPFVPGEVFPYFFTMEMFQRALIATLPSSATGWRTSPSGVLPLASFWGPPHR